jgi:hypothetical protein
MPRCTIKLAENKYVEWSTIVDAPVTYIQTREEHAEHLRNEYGRSYEHEIEPRLKRADERGASWQMGGSTGDETIRGNRAGPGESKITKEQILEMYVDEDSYNRAEAVAKNVGKQ